jgi:2'-5' RNA ligase
VDTDSAVRAVVAFPLLEPDDKQWIDSIRAKHDPEAKHIAAHFTLVFPAVMPLRTTEAHVARVAQSTEPIRFVLRRAVVAPNTVGHGGHVFLLVEDGRDALTGLHERLYEGVPRSHPKRMASFTPHVTVAANPSAELLHTLAAELNARVLAIRGSIAEVVLVEVTSAEIRHIARVPLSAGPV